MQQHSVRYTVMFAAAVCVVCSIFVAGAAVLTRPMQKANKILDVQKKVLDVAGLLGDGELTAQEVGKRFETNVKSVVVNLKSGKVLTDVDAATFDQQQAAKDPEQSVEAPDNPAKVARLPNNGLVYRIEKDGKLETLILPVEGKGLWSTLYGFLALDKDSRTIKGITFYQHAETPGLGGEVDNPRWKALWPGRKAFDDKWQPAIKVKKGQAGSVEEDPYNVDGLSGATLTARGVESLAQFWLGEHGFGPFLASYRAAKGIK